MNMKIGPIQYFDDTSSPCKVYKIILLFTWRAVTKDEFNNKNCTREDEYSEYVQLDMVARSWNMSNFDHYSMMANSLAYYFSNGNLLVNYEGGS